MLCRFYGWTPADVRALTLNEYRVFADYAVEVAKRERG